MKNFMSPRGFTLIETLIYVAIFGILVTALTSFASALITTRIANQLVFEVNDQGSQAIKILTQTLRNAKQVNSPTIGNTAANLSIVTESPATSPTVFSASGGVLYITEGSDSSVALTNKNVTVSNLLFSNVSHATTPNSIKVSFTLTSTSTKSSIVAPYTATFDGTGTLRK